MEALRKAGAVSVTVTVKTGAAEYAASFGPAAPAAPAAPDYPDVARSAEDIQAEREALLAWST